MIVIKAGAMGDIADVANEQANHGTALMDDII
jgi:hypothetical protein